MLKHTTLSCLLACIGLSTLAGGCSSAEGDESWVDTREQRVIYDSNSQSEVGNLPYWHPWFVEARSMGALVKKSQLTCGSSECELTWSPHETGVVNGRILPLCSDEPFVGQPVASQCTAFLIAPDLMATAGHCARNTNWCQDAAVVFDYTVNRRTGVANTTFDRNHEVYDCAELVALGYEGSEIEDNDFAVFRLDRVANARVPMPLRTSGTIPHFTNLDTLSFPLGLPLKLDDGGNVRNTMSEFPRFETTIDSAPGSSGGAVFNAETGKVEGILVDGTSKIFKVGKEPDGSDCARSFQCDGWDGCAVTDHRWVLVSRIERVVEVLEDRSCFDRKQNAEETDVDCGGPHCKACEPGEGCEQDSDCGNGYRPPACHLGFCNGSNTCEVDTSTCECQVDSHCDDGNPCTRDVCGRNVCFRYDDACN